MTFFGAAWGLGLTEISPVAKLVAIRFGDCCDVDGGGRVDMSDLQRWCCAAWHEVSQALELLSEQTGASFSIIGNVIEYQLPDEARPTRRAATISIDPTHHLYVLRGRIGVKIGITGSLGTRVDNLRAATLDDTVALEWSVTDRRSIVRAAERLSHQMLAPKLIRNEWFSVTADEAITTCIKAIDQAKRGEK